jgi:hypothetical protein
MRIGPGRSYVSIGESRPEMPRYYFHFKRGQVTLMDHDGLELADVDDAVHEAVRRARQIAGQTNLFLGSIVVDDEWRTLFEVPLRDVTSGIEGLSK